MRKVIVGISLFWVGTAFSQNLINNCSFENYEICPRQLADFDTKKWLSPTSGTPDYYHVCCPTDRIASPKNEWNNLAPQHGKSYIGLVGYLKRNITWREYLMTEIKTPLEKGVTSQLSFYMGLDRQSVFAIDELGILFSERPMYAKGSGPLDTVPSVKMNDFDILRSTEWQKVEVEYTAKGGEQFLIVGNFTRKNQRLLKANLDSEYFEAYYFFDSFDLQGEGIATPTSPNIATTTKLIANQKFILNNLEFETNKHHLMGNAQLELNKLASLMHQYPEFDIAISGYTDNKGDAKFNKMLSEKRAQSVFTYLKSKGISTARMSFSGYGVATPIANNSTPEGRAKNRRVEVLIKRSNKTASGRQ